MARLLLAWMSTEAVKTQSPVLVLGDPLAEFMRQRDMQDEAIALVVIERGSAIRWIGSLALCFSSSRRSEGRTTRHGSGTPSSNRGTGPPLVDHCVASSSSPGGKEENTGAASKFSDKLTMGTVEVTSSDPLKLLRPNRGAMFCASCPLGNRVSSTLASIRPSASLAVKVMRAAVSEGLA